MLDIGAGGAINKPFKFTNVFVGKHFNFLCCFSSRIYTQTSILRLKVIVYLSLNDSDLEWTVPTIYWLWAGKVDWLIFLPSVRKPLHLTCLTIDFLFPAATKLFFNFEVGLLSNEALCLFYSCDKPSWLYHHSLEECFCLIRLHSASFHSGRGWHTLDTLN